jgi:hypothetical protein
MAILVHVTVTQVFVSGSFSERNGQKILDQFFLESVSYEISVHSITDIPEIHVGGWYSGKEVSNHCQVDVKKGCQFKEQNRLIGVASSKLGTHYKS